MIDLLVIGGGPAGMIAAGRAAERGASVLLVEKNASLGKKLLISGGGRCNFTNAEPDPRQLATHYGKAQQALLSPFHKFSSSEVLAWFSQRGMPYKIEDNQRAFPIDNQARSVLAVLEHYLEEGRVRVKLSTEIQGLKWIDQDGVREVAGVMTRHGVLVAKNYLLATGGTSRPETGSTGDGFRWLSEAGLSVRFPEPSLVPVAVKEAWVSELSGLSFAEVGLGAWVGKTCLEYRKGKLLFTHFGLSGPLVLNFATALSQFRSRTAREGELVLKIDFFPGLDDKTVDRLILERFSSNSGKKLKNSLNDLLPPRAMPRVLQSSGVDGEKVLAQVTRAERDLLRSTLKGFGLTFRKLMDESRAVVSSGGLSIEEIDWRTMRCKKISNLAVTGDLLDINRPSGGYSLQLCWATGWVAGSSAD